MRKLVGRSVLVITVSAILTVAPFAAAQASSIGASMANAGLGGQPSLIFLWLAIGAGALLTAVVALSVSRRRLSADASRSVTEVGTMEREVAVAA